MVAKHRQTSAFPRGRLCVSVGQQIKLFLGFFLVILVLKFPILHQPPVWDSSMSVFPAAITLSEHDFDAGFLLKQPSYEDGGPNVHSLSLITWVTAVVIKMLGEQAALLPVLHLLHFAIAAAAILGIFRFAQTMLSPPSAAIASLAVMIFPLMLTQIGFMYLEIPLVLLTTLALLSWVRRDFVLAALWATLAVLVKESGLIVAAALALATLSTLSESRWRSIALFIVPPAVVALLTSSGKVGGPGHLGAHLASFNYYLRNVPDLAFLMGLFPLVLVRRKLRPAIQTTRERAYVAASSLFVAFFGFYLALPIAGQWSVLPRYYLQVFPFVFLTLLALLEERFGSRAAFVAAAVSLLIFTVNRSGDLYGNNTINNFALIERSGAYTDLLRLQQGDVLALEKISGPVFYDQSVHYRLSYPLMGYARHPLADGHSIRHEEPYVHARLDDFPDEFTMLLEYPWLGGELIYSIWLQAQSDPNRHVETSRLCSGQFCSTIISVTQADP